MGVVRACVAMLPRLTAEESLLAVTRTAIGTGSIEKEATKRIMAAWVTDAEGTPETPTRPTSARTVAAVRAVGLKVFGTTATP